MKLQGNVSQEFQALDFYGYQPLLINLKVQMLDRYHKF